MSAASPGASVMHGCVAMADPIFVAPHYDDVALSCGATIAQLAESCSPVMLTIFGGEPSVADVSEFAQEMHHVWGLDQGSAVRRRRSEDECAARALGSSVRRQPFDWLDAIYRDSRYKSDDELFGPLLEGEDDLSEEIALRIAAIGKGPIYVPLAVGNHVDHQLAFAAGKKLAQVGRTVYAYADMPYALNRRTLTARLGLLGALPSFTVTISEDDFERKWEAIQCYPSQLRMLFRDMPQPRQRFRQFMSEAGNGSLAERFWRLQPSR